MQNFKVFNNDFSFKSTTHSFKLVLYGSTSVKKTELPDIPVNHPNILGLASIHESRFQSNMLLDIVGRVTKITQTQVNADNNKNKADEDIPLEFPYELDAILTKELAIRAIFQQKYVRLYVIGFKDDEESRRKIRDNFKCGEAFATGGTYQFFCKSILLSISTISTTDNIVYSNDLSSSPY
ncbi:hypothetical protein KIW84_032705 [Lathyrus oleraceus]|uniref:Uncharacterized protein n=1 Tax=Pisum sativum TaxID=3888 RepID=A0A9D4XWG1_PEA|nr:hypothetical protein KIW84_032705 [Pisum sativum]